MALAGMSAIQKGRWQLEGERIHGSFHRSDAIKLWLEIGGVPEVIVLSDSLFFIESLFMKMSSFWILDEFWGNFGLLDDKKRPEACESISVGRMKLQALKI